MMHPSDDRFFRLIVNYGIFKVTEVVQKYKRDLSSGCAATKMISLSLSRV